MSLNELTETIPSTNSEAVNLMTNLTTQYMDPRKCLMENRTLLRSPLTLADRTAIAGQNQAYNTTCADTYVGGTQQSGSSTGCVFAMLFPHARSALWLTTGSPLTVGGILTYGTLWRANASGYNAMISPLCQPLFTTSPGAVNSGVLPYIGGINPPANIPLGVPWYPITLGAVTSGAVINVQITSVLAEDVTDFAAAPLPQLFVGYRTQATQTWTVTGATFNYISNTFTNSVTTSLNTSDAWCCWVGFPQYYSAWTGQLLVTITPGGGGGTIVIPNVPHNFTVHDWPILQEWPVQRTAFIAGSLLCSYVGSDLYNGGDIAMVRCPIGVSPVNLNSAAETGFPAISTVPYAYFGALKTGAYAWLLPGLDAMRLSAPNSRSFTAGLFCAMNFNTRTSSVLVTATQIFAGTCTTGVLALGAPPLVPGFQEAYYILRAAPCATENPTHSSTLMNAIHKTAKVLSSDLFLDTVSALGSAAGAVGVPGASLVATGARGAKKLKKRVGRERLNAMPPSTVYRLPSAASGPSSAPLGADDVPGRGRMTRSSLRALTTAEAQEAPPSKTARPKRGRRRRSSGDRAKGGGQTSSGPAALRPRAPRGRSAALRPGSREAVVRKPFQKPGQPLTVTVTVKPR